MGDAEVTDDAKPDRTPFDDMDYDPDGRPPSTGSVGALALQIVQLYKIDGRNALSVAILIDQGRVSNALELGDICRQALADEAQAKKDDRRQR